MGLLDNVIDNSAFQLGMNILGNNRYGDNTGMALGAGLQDYQRQKSLQAQQARANAQAQYQAQMQQQQQEQWQQKQAQYKQAQERQAIEQQAMQKQYPNIANLPQFAQQAAMKNKFPSASTYGTTPHFDAKGNAFQLSTGGGSRKIGPQLQKPAHFINYGGGQMGLNPFSGQQVTPNYPTTLKPSEKPAYKSQAKAAEVEGKALGTAKTELADRAATLPRLKQVIDELSTLGKKATYTQAGQAFDSTKRQLGLKSGEGAIARKEYISKVDNEILPLLRLTFGAAFTAAEGESLKATLGDPNASPEEKDAVLRSFIDSKTESINTLKRRTGQGQNLPAVGEEKGGYRFKGGNPAKPESWEKMP